MGNIQKRLAITLSFFAFLFVFFDTTLSHNTIGKRVDDYNITLELIQLTQLGQSSDENAVSHADEMATILSVGHFEVNVYLLNPLFQPVDAGEVELVLSTSSNTSPTIQLLSQGTGRYKAEWDITEPGIWDFQVTVRVPEAQRALVANYDDIEILSVADANAKSTASGANEAENQSPGGLSIPLIAIGAAAIILAVAIIIISMQKPKRNQKGA